MSASKTAYSIGCGGQAGYINLGGWNSTLTDVNTSAQEVCGITRFDGANQYMYVMNGSQSAARAAFVQICTALADDSGSSIVAPVRVTSVAAASCEVGGIVFGMWVPTAIATNQYGWILRKGFATCFHQTNSGVTNGAYIVPGTATADTWACAVTNTARGFSIAETVATATAVLGYWGYVNFEGQTGSP
jgi:hypothetical protein